MNLAELKNLRNTPKEQMREVVNSLEVGTLETTIRIEREIKRIQDGAKFYPKDFTALINSLCSRTAMRAYRDDDDGGLMFESTCVNALVQRDVFGKEIPEYIKQLPGWDEIVSAGLAE